MPTLSVMDDEGHPTQAPCRRIWTMPSGVMLTSSISPPSAWTAGRMRERTRATLSCTDGPIVPGVPAVVPLGAWGIEVGGALGVTREG